MDDGPAILDETTQAASPMTGKRDAWLEQRLTYLAGEQARLKGGLPLRRFLRGALVAYRRFLHTGEPAYRFHCWVTIRTVSAGLDQLERGGSGSQAPRIRTGRPGPWTVIGGRLDGATPLNRTPVLRRPAW
jgi:hypothetical protein